MDSTTRLTRSRSDRMIAGVAGGVARYLNTDPALVRLAFVLLALSGPALFIYPLLWLVMPQEPAGPVGQVFVATGKTQRLRLDPLSGGPDDPEQEIPINNLGGDAAPPRGGQTGQGGRLLGFILLGLGLFITLQMLWPGFTALLFPVALIGVGIWLLRRGA
jgi:phage shock protein C